MELNWLDFAIIGVVLLSGLASLARGFVLEAIGLSALVLAGFACYYLGPEARPYAQQYLGDNPLFVDLAAYAGVFILSAFAFSIGLRLILSSLLHLALGPINRALGFLFGLARGALMVCVAYLLLFIALPPEEQPDFIKTAKTMPWIAKGTEALALYTNNLLKGMQLDLALPVPSSSLSGLQDDTRALIKGQEALERLKNRVTPDQSTPTSTNDSTNGDGTGYNGDQRRTLENLFQQQKAP